VLKRLFKALAYTRAPRSTFALLHPRKAIKYAAIFWIGKKLLGGRGSERTPRNA
jgi:hypothetical protein